MVYVKRHHFNAGFDCFADIVIKGGVVIDHEGNTVHLVGDSRFKDIVLLFRLAVSVLDIQADAIRLGGIFGTLDQRYKEFYTGFSIDDESNFRLITNICYYCSWGDCCGRCRGTCSGNYD